MACPGNCKECPYDKCPWDIKAKEKSDNNTI